MKTQEHVSTHTPDTLLKPWSLLTNLIVQLRLRGISNATPFVDDNVLFIFSKEMKKKCLVIQILIDLNERDFGRNLI